MKLAKIFENTDVSSDWKKFDREFVSVCKSTVQKFNVEWSKLEAQAKPLKESNFKSGYAARAFHINTLLEEWAKLNGVKLKIDSKKVRYKDGIWNAGYYGYPEDELYRDRGLPREEWLNLGFGKTLWEMAASAHGIKKWKEPKVFVQTPEDIDSFADAFVDENLDELAKPLEEFGKKYIKIIAEVVRVIYKHKETVLEVQQQYANFMRRKVEIPTILAPWSVSVHKTKGGQKSLILNCQNKDVMDGTSASQSDVATILESGSVWLLKGGFIPAKLGDKKVDIPSGMKEIMHVYYAYTVISKDHPR